jgi:L-fuconolactonase
MFVDTHVHFWRLDRNDPIGINRRIAGIERDFTPEDLRGLTEPLGISRVVVVQAAPTTTETEHLLDLAVNDPFIAAVVGWVDLESEEAPRTLGALAKRAKFAGIRAMVSETRLPGWLSRPSVRRGLSALRDLDLALDLVVRPTQLPDALRLVREMPGLRANINHCGRPLIVAHEWQPWAELMAAIGTQSEIVCKLSGLIERGGFEWSLDDLRPYVSHLLASFGPDRLMFASNWPVSNLTGTYRRWWEALNQVLADLGVGGNARTAIFHDTAVRFYRL